MTLSLGYSTRSRDMPTAPVPGLFRAAFETKSLQVCPRVDHGYHEAIGLSCDNGTVYVSDLSGAVRKVDLKNGTDDEVANLGVPLAGMATIHM